MKLKALVAAAVAISVFTFFAPTHAQNDAAALAEGFRNPPDSAKPRTWWHWTGGNVTREGITKDLEWMKRVGIAGFQLADVSAGGGQTVERTIDFGTPAWYDTVRHAAAEADRRRRAVGAELEILLRHGRDDGAVVAALRCRRRAGRGLHRRGAAGEQDGGGQGEGAMHAGSCQERRPVMVRFGAMSSAEVIR